MRSDLPTPPPSSRSPRRLARAAPLRLEIAARTDPGLARDHNEDSLLVASFGAPERTTPCAERRDVASGGWAALAVCDGMGGAAAGEVASRIAVEVIAEELRVQGPASSRDALGHRLIRCLEEASRRVHAQALGDRSKHGMGTTATACALRDETLFVAQVGDSRAYLFRDGALARLTRDQTLTQLMLENGQLAPEDARDFAYGNIILQAVGTAPRVDVDLTEVTVRHGDVLLVCSDGLHGPVGDEAIRAVLATERAPARAVDALIERALAAGAPDNVTCIVARIEGGALREPAEPPVARKAVLAGDPRAVADTDPALEVAHPTPDEGLLRRFLGRLRRS